MESRNLENLFSDYLRTRTARIIDLRTNYTFCHSLPFNIESDIMLYGGPNAGEVILEPDISYKKNQYSTYIQASYPFIAGQKVDLDAFIGSGFSLNDRNFLYGNSTNSFDIVNIGLKASKTLKITEHHRLPVTMMTTWNPSKKYARIQLAATAF